MTAHLHERREDLRTRRTLDVIFARVIPEIIADDRAGQVDSVAALTIIRATALAVLALLHDDEILAPQDRFGIDPTRSLGTSTTGILVDEDDPEDRRTIEAPLTVGDSLADFGDEPEDLDDHEIAELALLVATRMKAGTFTDRESIELGLVDVGFELNEVGRRVMRVLIDRQAVDAAMVDLRALGATDADIADIESLRDDS